MNPIDIRDKEYLTDADVSRLNFIAGSRNRAFRMHYRQGLRSRIIEILSAEDIRRETKGVEVDGLRQYPRAVPGYMLRILRTRLGSLSQALSEVRKYTLIDRYLGPDYIARSEEFIVEYTGTGGKEIVLCGLQEYVKGAILDPWNLVGEFPLDSFYRSNYPELPPEKPLETAYAAITEFVAQVRKMLERSSHIPDLAGVGNLLITSEGKLKLVDINNIVHINRTDTIVLDDRAYPSCDKSVEVLYILEKEILGAENLENDALYALYLTEERRKKVRKLEEIFYQSLRPAPDA